MSNDQRVRLDVREPEMELSKRLLMSGRIDEGGMGLINQVVDRNLMRRSAIKILKNQNAFTESSRRHLIEEAQITAQLDHPNIVPVYELGQNPKGALFFTMKHVKGVNLFSILQHQDFFSRTPKEMMEQVRILSRVCDAIAFAHSRGVIHCDLKPDNIMVGDYGQVYLMDWGIAKVIAPQGGRGPRRDTFERESGRPENRGSVTVIGTPHYMSPEQAEGRADDIDERTDVFGLGAILYEILCGEPPFNGEGNEIFDLARECRIVNPRDRVPFPLPSRLCAIAMKALAKNPDRRHPSATAFKEELEGFLDSGWQFEKQVYPPGAVIVREGEPGDSAFIITRGRCRIWRNVGGRRTLVGEMKDGDVFGEISVFTGEPRSASVEAVDEVIVRVVTRAQFEDDLGMGFWMGVFARALARRFQEISERNARNERRMVESGLELETLRFFAGRGVRTVDGRCAVRWSELVGWLAERTGRPLFEAGELILGMTGLSVDSDRDTATIETV